MTETQRLRFMMGLPEAPRFGSPERNGKVLR
jgi:hypothetical protein